MILNKYDLNFIASEVLPILNKTNSQLALDEFSRPYENYIKRVEKLDLVGMKIGLDAGCGLGNWTFPLAEKNIQIIGIDFDKEKIQGANLIAQHLKCQNVKFIHGDLSAIPCDDNSLDFILLFCIDVHRC
jgi:ubiquinone/menaquinone biosynthesis C-methylase UbiE